jgi:hypothetical protein
MRKGELTKAKIEAVVDQIKSGETDVVIAEVMELHPAFIANIRKTLKHVDKDPEHDLDLLKLQAKNRKQGRAYREALKKVDALEAQVRAMEQYGELRERIVPYDFAINTDDGKEMTAFTVASDWHIDEIVHGAEINFVNEFNLDIARKRVKLYFHYVARILKMLQNESPIRRLVITALGDFISGWIHEELMQTNSMTPPEAVDECFEMWVSGLKYLLAETDVEILFLACSGNHARITPRMHAKGSHVKNYEWLLYRFLAMWFHEMGEDRIKFKLPTGYFNLLNVYGKDIRVHHGERIRYNGGVGGITIPLNKAIAAWNKTRHVDLDILGHFHQRIITKCCVMNGSLVGYNEFAEMIKADYEPPQQSFFALHKKHGKTAEFPINLNENDLIEDDE